MDSSASLWYGHQLHLQAVIKLIKITFVLKTRNSNHLNFGLSRLLNQTIDSTPTSQAVNYVFPEVYRRHVLALNFPFHARKQIVHFDELSVFCPVLGDIARQ